MLWAFTLLVPALCCCQLGTVHAGSALDSAVALLQADVHVAGLEEAQTSLHSGRPRRRRHRQEVAVGAESKGLLVGTPTDITHFGEIAETLPTPLPDPPTATAELDTAVSQEAAAVSWAAAVPRAAAAVPADFEVGETVEVLDSSEGVSRGSWVFCTIAAKGAYPGTFDIFVPAAAEGQQEYANVPTKLLRRPNPKAAPSSFFSFEVGDLVEVMTTSRSRAGTWSPATITKMGSHPGLYDINVPFAPDDRQDIWDVPATFLRPVDKQRLLSALPRGPAFAPGERAELRAHSGPLRGRWLPCVILGSGQKEDTYDVRMQDPHQSPLDFPNVPAPFLRKAAYQPPSVEPAYEPAAAPAVEDEEPAPVFEPAVADEEPLPAVAAEPVAKPVVEEPLPAVTAEPAAKPAAEPLPAATTEPAAKPIADDKEPPAATDSGVAFAVGAVVQLQVQEGPRAGDWITVSITGKGSKPDTYQVSTGFEELHDVPATSLRQSGTSDDWTI